VRSHVDLEFVYGDREAPIWDSAFKVCDGFLDDVCEFARHLFRGPLGECFDDLRARDDAWMGVWDGIDDKCRGVCHGFVDAVDARMFNGHVAVISPEYP